MSAPGQRSVGCVGRRGQGCGTGRRIELSERTLGWLGFLPPSEQGLIALARALRTVSGDGFGPGGAPGKT